MSGVYYNEFDKNAAAWLRELIRRGLIPDGEVDERSIHDVRPSDLAGFVACHCFAGIGGWAYAGRLAGLSDGFRWWSGSCPCQPYSVAGKGEGDKDPRDLWPVWSSIIRECAPPIVIGEQVPGAIGHGWLDRTAVDLESEGYAVGAVVLPAFAVGAPHRRERLFWVADAESLGRRRREDGQDGRRGEFASADSGEGSMEHAYRSRLEVGSFPENKRGNLWGKGAAIAAPGARDFWSDAEWLTGADGKSRRVQRGFESDLRGMADGFSDSMDTSWAGRDGETVPLLVQGFPSRIGLLRGYGNAIVPQVAAEFISAFMECRP